MKLTHLITFPRTLSAWAFTAVIALMPMPSTAQETSAPATDSQAISDTLVATESDNTSQGNNWNPRRNWYGQLGLDMTLQKPYSYPMRQMIPKGMSFGVDAAVGHWFTPQMGLRVKFNWENGISLLKNNKLEWLAPFEHPEQNMKKGGYFSLVGDILFDIHNIIWGYKSSRRWNTQIFLRAGGVYNLGCDKGSPLIGLGWGNTVRLSRHWGLYADVAYNGVSSGFNGVGTGTGNGSNMYFDFDLGVTYYIHGTDFQEPAATKGRKYFRGFWDNWYLQCGTEMTLYNPCEKDFRDVFPDGVVGGIDLSLGKWFSPQIGLRGRINWANCLIENKHLKWLPYEEPDESNYEGGGCFMMYADMTLSLKHLFRPFVQGERWNSYVFGRLGLGKNRSIDSLSPIVGAGVGGTFRFNPNWSLYFETAYEGITSEFFDGVSWSGATGSAFNGIWEFNIGVQLNIGDLHF